MKRGHYDLREIEYMLGQMNNSNVPMPTLWKKLSSAYREVLADIEKLEGVRDDLKDAWRDSEDKLLQQIKELEEREEQLEKGWRESDEKLIKQNEELDKENADLHDEIKQRKAHAAEYRLKIEDLERRLREEVGNIGGYLSQMEKDASHIAKLEQRIEELSSLSAQHLGEAVACDKECGKLLTKIAELEERLAGYETKAKPVDTLEEAEAKADALILEEANKALPVFKLYGDSNIQVHYGSSMEVFEYAEPWEPKVCEFIKCYANDGSTHLRVFSEKRFGSYIDTSGASWLKVEPASIEDVKAELFSSSWINAARDPQPGDLVVSEMVGGPGFCAGVVKSVKNGYVYLNGGSGNSHLLKYDIKPITHKLDEEGNIVPVGDSQ